MSFGLAALVELTALRSAASTAAVTQSRQGATAVIEPLARWRARVVPFSSEQAAASPNDHPLTHRNQNAHTLTCPQLAKQKALDTTIPEGAGARHRDAGTDPLVLGLP